MASWAGKLSDALGLPRDALTGQPRFVIEGDGRLTVESHRGVLTFSPEKLRIGTSIGPVEVLGRNLQILWINKDDVIIGGNLSSVRLEDEVSGDARR